MEATATAKAKPPSSSSPPPFSSMTMRGLQKPDKEDFPLPALRTWGGQRHLRCMKAPANSGGGEQGRDRDAMGLETPEMGKTAPVDVVDDGLDQVRTKLMFHLREAADRLNLVGPQAERAEDAVAAERRIPTPVKPTAQKTSRSLRRRNATAAAASRTAYTGDSSHRPSPPRLLRPRRICTGKDDGYGGRLQPRKRFSLALSREEIDEDFYALTGRRAPGRPKKRSHAVKKQLDPLFPGSRLSEVTAALYKVAAPNSRDRRRVEALEKE